MILSTRLPLMYDSFRTNRVDWIYLLECTSTGSQDNASSLPFGNLCFGGGRATDWVGSANHINSLHSLTSSVFRSSDYLDTLLRIAKPSNSPPSFFSWNEPAGGLSASPSGGWIKNGYTVFCWMRVEAFPKGESRLPV